MIVWFLAGSLIFCHYLSNGSDSDSDSDDSVSDISVSDHELELRELVIPVIPIIVPSKSDQDFKNVHDNDERGTCYGGFN